MLSESERGPMVDGADFALRAIFTISHWVPSENRPSSAAFDTDYFSVDLKSCISAEGCRRRMASSSRPKAVLAMVEFNCGEARKIQFDTRQERDEIEPENDAHAHVYNLDYPNVGGKKRKTLAKRLIEICSIAINYRATDSQQPST